MREIPQWALDLASSKFWSTLTEEAKDVIPVLEIRYYEGTFSSPFEKMVIGWEFHRNGCKYQNAMSLSYPLLPSYIEDASETLALQLNELLNQLKGNGAVA